MTIGSPSPRDRARNGKRLQSIPEWWTVVFPRGAPERKQLAFEAATHGQEQLTFTEQFVVEARFELVTLCDVVAAERGNERAVNHAHPRQSQHGAAERAVLAMNDVVAIRERSCDAIQNAQRIERRGMTVVANQADEHLQARRREPPRRKKQTQCCQYALWVRPGESRSTVCSSRRYREMSAWTRSSRRPTSRKNVDRVSAIDQPSNLIQYERLGNDRKRIDEECDPHTVSKSREGAEVQHRRFNDRSHGFSSFL